MPFKNGNIPWNKGLTKEIDIRVAVSEETKQKMRKRMKGNQYLIGHKHSEESKQKMREAHKGIPMSDEAIINMRKAQKGHIGYMFNKKHSEEAKEKISKYHKGRKHSKEHKQKLSEAQKGEKSHCWKGGVTPLTHQIRHSFKYRQWRSDVFTRDNFICQRCGQWGGKLHAHHIKSFSSILQFYEITTFEEALDCEELWNINNGITLCKNCHKLTNNYLHKARKEILKCH